MNKLSSRDQTSRAPAGSPMRPGVGRAGLMVLAAAGALAVAGCEQHPYPTPAPDEQPTPPAPPSRLMGAPEGPDAATPRADDAPAADAPAYAPPSGGEIGDRYAAGAARPPCPPDPTYRGANGPAVIICNAPVPNPPEGEHEGRRWRHYGWRHHRHWSPAYAHEAAPAPYGRWAHHRHHIHRAFAGPVVAGPVVAAPDAGRVHHHRHPHLSSGVAPAPVAPIAAAPHPHHAAVPHPTRPRAAPHAGATHANGRPLKLAPVPTAAPTATTPTGGEASRFTALQTALGGELARQFTLNSPSHFSAGQTSEVTLNLPAGFAQTVQTDATAQQLDAAATSSNLTATLAGDGFAVTPEEAQSQPIAIGQPIVFRWKVTPQANAKGPLQAEVTLDMPSQGRSLPLGSVKSLAGVSRVGGRAIGVGLLILVALLGIGWAARGRRRPLPTGASRPRENHLTGI